MAEKTWQWMKFLAGSEQPEDYFNHPRAFSFLLLPWWAESSLTTTPDVEFQAALAYASVNAYYYIRLMDNLMDGNASLEASLLPATVFFSTQIQATYLDHFAWPSAFWDFLLATWLRQSEATMQDDSLTQRDEAQFLEIVTQKVCGAKIPIAAVCYRYECPQRMGGWSVLVDKLGAWHLMQQDMFDWRKDLQHQNMTYFLSEAVRSKNPNESIAEWVVRAGFSWGIGKLQAWMVEIRQLATELTCPPLLDYLDQRDALLLKQMNEISKGLVLLAKLGELAKGSVGNGHG